MNKDTTNNVVNINDKEFKLEKKIIDNLIIFFHDELFNVVDFFNRKGVHIGDFSESAARYFYYNILSIYLSCRTKLSDEELNFHFNKMKDEFKFIHSNLREKNDV